MSAAEAQDTAAMVVRTLQTLLNEEAFDLFWEKVINSAEAFNVEQPELPRKRKIPRKFDDGIGEHEYHSEPKPYHRQEYYEALDLAVGCIKDRFYQPGYLVYCHLQNLLLKASQRKDFQEDNFIKMTSIITLPIVNFLHGISTFLFNSSNSADNCGHNKVHFHFISSSKTISV